MESSIDVSGLVIDEKIPTTLAFVQLDSKGDRSFTFYRNPGADVMLTSAEVNRNLIDDAAIFHFGSVSLTSDPSRTATLEAARYARQQGKLVSFDPNYRPLLWEHPADAVVQMQEGVTLADLLKVSEEEMQLITNESDLARGSQALLEMGPSLVLVSLGAKGAYYRNAVGAGHLPTYDVPTVDTTGAGDAFMGAIHYQLRRKAAEDLRTLPAFELEEIVRFGNAAGSLTTTKGRCNPCNALHGRNSELHCLYPTDVKKGYPMTKLQIRMRQVDQVKDFVDLLSKYPYEMDLVSGRYTIDAKSLLGIYSLDLSNPLTLRDLFRFLRRTADTTPCAAPRLHRLIFYAFLLLPFAPFNSGSPSPESGGVFDLYKSYYHCFTAIKFAKPS